MSITLNIILWSIISIWAFFFELDEMPSVWKKTVCSIFAPVLITIIFAALIIFFGAMQLFGWKEEESTDLL